MVTRVRQPIVRRPGDTAVHFAGTRYAGLPPHKTCALPRAAVTLTEILVVCAILAALFALSVFAVYRTRSAAHSFQRDAWREQRALGKTGPRSSPIRILFIGNSFTATNDLPGVLTALANTSTAGPELVVDSHLVGGATLQQHWESGDALQKIQSSDWDFVVLQEQSQTPLPQFGRDEIFYPYARLFDKEIRQAGAITLFYMTWARPDTPGPQSWWTDSYVGIAKELRAECAPCGIAFEKTRQSLPHLNLYLDGNGHPTPLATYLIACTFFATIYDRTPQGLPNSQGIAESDIAALQSFAWESHKEVKKRIRPL